MAAIDEMDLHVARNTTTFILVSSWNVQFCSAYLSPYIYELCGEEKLRPVCVH